MNRSASLTRLKHMCAWDTDPVLTDEDMQALLNASRRLDSSGRNWDTDGWIPTFDLYWAAAEAWAWKAGASADRYKILADNSELNRQQVHQHCVNMFQLYAKRSFGARPQSVRSPGNLLVDRLGAYSTVPWWWELSA